MVKDTKRKLQTVGKN